MVSFNTTTGWDAYRAHLAILHVLKVRGTEMDRDKRCCLDASSLRRTFLKAVTDSQGTKEIMLFERMVDNLCGFRDNGEWYDHGLL